MIRKMLLPPLATQAFPRGEYTLDFDFNKSDGLSSGTIARFKVNFTNKLNLDDDADTAKQPKEIWAEFSVGDSVMGSRSRLPDNAMVQLLLSSGASIATYLTPACESDASIAADTRAANNWYDSGLDVYTLGKVGIGTAALIQEKLQVVGGATPALRLQANSGVAALNIGGTGLIKVDAPGIGGGRFFLNDSGYVGIGTASPVNPVQVSATGGKGFALPNGFHMGIDSGGNAHMELVTNGAVSYIDFLNDNTEDFDARIILAGNGDLRVDGPLPDPYIKVNFRVNGKIACRELEVSTAAWSDFVFQNNYRLPPLDEVAAFISENKHLPGIPSEKEVMKDGFNVGVMSSKLLQKIEELTLYMIELKKENEALKTQIGSIQLQLGK